MSYQVGIDLGTTYTAAAVYRDGVATIFSLGSRAAVIPSVVLLRQDGTILTGDAADRRAMTEPERVVREFKRRLGDTTPIIVAGTPYSAEALTARLLESVLDEIRAREDSEPSRIVITHPANWGNYKRDLLQQAVRLAGLDPDAVGFISEPEAAALAYAAQERVEAGEVVAVYDLGGGTFDAAVLRRTDTGFAIIGKPEGIERLGGIDFDAAVFAHVSAALGDAMTSLDPDDPAVLAAVARLRQDCIEAKEALSSDADASIPVLLPRRQTEVRITRREFEALIRPALVDSIEAMRRAVRSADLEMGDVSRVLLVGGSSRIPLISLLVSSELGRPFAVDAHPKHTIALGAAHAAGGLLDRGTGATSAPRKSPSSSSPGPSAAPAASSSPSPADPNRTMVAPDGPALADLAAKAVRVTNPGPPPGATPAPNASPNPSASPRPSASPTPSPSPARSPLPSEQPRPRRAPLPVEGARPERRPLPVERSAASPGSAAGAASRAPRPTGFEPAPMFSPGRPPGSNPAPGAAVTPPTGSSGPKLVWVGGVLAAVAVLVIALLLITSLG